MNEIGRSSIISPLVSVSMTRFKQRNRHFPRNKSFSQRMQITMPETAITSKSTVSRSALASSREEATRHITEKRLPRYVQRKFLTYTSQLPVRCQRPGRYYRPPWTSFRLTNLPTINRTPAINSAKSCPDNSTCSLYHVIAAQTCKKTLSMIDLSPLVMDTENGDIKSDSSLTVERYDENERHGDSDGNDTRIGTGIKRWMESFVASDTETEMLIQNPRKAASLVCHVLVLNAWRRRRSELSYLRTTIDDLSQQIEHLHLQIVVLRRLLDTENNRVGKLSGEMHRTKVLYDETLKERNALKTENEKMNGEIKRLNELSEERLVVAENVRNELLTARNQLQALDEQMSKDREKLLKLREDKRMLLDKVTACEALAMERGIRADKAESMVEDLQAKLAAQISLVESSRDQIERYLKELKMKEEEKSRLLRRLKSSEEVARTLNQRTSSLETQLADRETSLQRLQTDYNSQLMELNELKERLIRQSQESGWSSRMLQLAGSVVRAPRAILRTLLASPVITS